MSDDVRSAVLAERRRVLDIVRSSKPGDYFPRQYRTAVETILTVIAQEIATPEPECCELCDDEDEHHSVDPIAAQAGAA